MYLHEIILTNYFTSAMAWPGFHFYCSSGVYGASLPQTLWCRGQSQQTSPDLLAPAHVRMRTHTKQTVRGYTIPSSTTLNLSSLEHRGQRIPLRVILTTEPVAAIILLLLRHTHIRGVVPVCRSLTTPPPDCDCGKVLSFREGAAPPAGKGRKSQSVWRLDETQHLVKKKKQMSEGVKNILSNLRHEMQTLTTIVL